MSGQQSNNIAHMRAQDGRGEYGLVLPHNIEAEQGLIGMVLIDNRHFDAAGTMLRPEHFFQPVHGRIWEAMAHMIAGGRAATPVTMKNHFDTDDGLKDVGGARYLAELCSETPLLNDAVNYARIIHDMYVRREMISVFEDMRARAYTPEYDDPAAKIIEDTEGLLFNIAEYGAESRPAVTAIEAYDLTLDYIDKAQKGEIRGVMTGLGALDDVLTGLEPSSVTILAARPSMGKTVLAMNIAEYAAMCDRPASFFSLEMPNLQLMMRMMARHTGVATGKMRSEGAMTADDFRALTESRGRFQDLPLMIEDMPALTPSQIMTRARRHKRKHGLDLLVIDYLGLMESETDNPVQAVKIGDITKGIKRMAMELNIAVLMLAQLNRGVEGRDDKRPQLSDLRDSGSIEQDADNVMFLYRDEYYLERATPQKKASESPDSYGQRVEQYEAQLAASRGKADIIVAKQRMGPVKTVTVGFDRHKLSFTNL